ncbi:hypothetical protein JKF63_03137 [Porcisia hertigi]|uniref:Uncharacterized protein n=1 Tax=Porcisia hertigi TaxID=2761500 RepID=A0A836LG00_9TRYP|nr:hypothetical protein JKF63_03137 [Porcisia hertigi]
MGTHLSLLVRKRPREGVPESASSQDGCSSPSLAASPPSSLSHLLLSLRYRSSSPSRAGSKVCRCVLEDERTRHIYGCHAHVYEAKDENKNHGVALAWRIDDSAAPLSTLSLLSLCRVANSSHKKVLVTTQNGEAVLLTYTAAL